MEIIRPLDGVEAPLIHWWLAVTDVFVDVDIPTFKKRLESMGRYTVMNLGIHEVKGHPHWIKRPFVLEIEEVEWQETEGLLKSPYMKTEYDASLYKIKYSQRGNITQITFFVSHTISDGRTVFEFYEFVRAAVGGYEVDYQDTPLCGYGQRDKYTLPDSAYIRPSIWDGPEGVILPAIKPTTYTNEIMSFPNKPISKACSVIGVTYQAILTTIFSRAFRSYYSIPNSSPLLAYSPSDTRPSPCATELHKRRHFYNNAGANLYLITATGDMLTDIKTYSEEIKKTRFTTDSAVQDGISGMYLDPETFKPADIVFPNLHKQRIIVSSNIGLVKGTNPTLRLYGPACEFYSVVLYGYHTEETFYTMLFRPLEIPSDLTAVIKKEINTVIEWVMEQK